jgi:hypothetical protein
VRPNRLLLCVLASALAALPARPQETPPLEPIEESAAEPAGPGGPELRWGLEVKAAFRDSDANAFRTTFSTSGGPPVSLATVDPGTSLEVPAVTLFLDATWGEALAGRVKVDLIDLWDRNPTSTDGEVDVDEAWLRYGRESEPATLPDRARGYVKVGKLPKFERQDDRHLESYGLATTAFNRFEDLGVEVGIDLGRHLFVKGSYTRGNPVFLRDPNALAGDNGTPEAIAGQRELGSGVVMLYDAEVEDLQGGGNEETGAGLGLRFANADASARFELLAWGYRRRLADTVSLEGTAYGGDLDLVTFPPFPTLPDLDGDDKQELGGNLWLYLGGFSFFGQYVDQELAGLPRTAWEAEAAWRFELPLVWAIGGQQLFPSIAPAVRFSQLDPDFRNPSQTPVPSLAWEWEKLDAGIRLGLTPGTDLTVEYARNRFLTAAGWRDNDELLSTLRWRM